MSQEKKVFKTEWANRSLTIETVNLLNKPMVLYSFVMVIQLSYQLRLLQKNRDGDFFPLMVNYEEKCMLLVKSRRIQNVKVAQVMKRR